MEEKTVVATSQATTVAITATASAEETTTSTATTTAECELPTVDNSVATESSAVADSSTAGEAGTADFSIPLTALDSLNKMTRLIGELYTYSYLLNKATGMTEPSLYIDVRMCDDLAEAITMEEFRSVMKEFITATDYVRGIELKKDQLVFTCFENLTDTGMKTAAASLFNLMAKSITGNSTGADKKRRLNLHNVQIKQPENEKFAFRSWLTKLAWKGSEGKTERNLLYRNLNGNTAFCTEESKIRWEAKHKKGRKNEPTTIESVSTAEEESEVETVVETTVAEPETDIEIAEAVAV